MELTCELVAKLLLERDNIVIFAHRKPDGDTIGSCFGLYHALKGLGKRVRIECADPLIRGRFAKIFGSYQPETFEAAFLVAADVASEDLLSGVHLPYGRPVDVCIDHHKSNTFFALRTLLDPTAAATAEIALRVIQAMGVKPDKNIANAIFTGLTTDTGCFKFSNTTAGTHMAAAEMLRWGADSAFINKLMFDTKSRGRLEVDKAMMDSLSYHFDGKCAVIFLPEDTAQRYGVTEEELDGISAFPRSIEGVLAGVTIREKGEDYRISLRTVSPMDASAVCSAFGGGGHSNAAGCTLSGTLEEAKEKILSAVEKEIAKAL